MKKTIFVFLTLMQVSATVCRAQDGAVQEVTLDQVIKNVIYYNPAVEAARLEWRAADKKIRAAWGVYEPGLTGSYKYADTDRENTTLEMLQQGGSSHFLEINRQYNLAVEGKSFLGTDYNAGYSVVDSKNNLTLTNEFKTFAGLSLTQPLFKGLWFGGSWAAVKAAKIDRTIAFHNYRTKLMQIIYQTESAYWNLSLMQEKRRVAGESVGIARKLVEDSQARMRVGLLSKMDLEEAEAGLAIRLANQADAQQELTDAVNRLKLLLSSDQIQDQAWLKASTPLSLPDDKFLPEILGLDALKIQPDYLLKLNELNKEKTELAFQKSQALPQIDAKGSLGYNALGQNFDQAWLKIKDQKHPDWSIGLQIKVPLFMNASGRNSVAAAKLKKQMAEENLKAVRYELLSSLQSLRQRAASLQERIGNAQTVAEFRKRLLDSEMQRMPSGKSNARLIYEAEEKFSEAKQAKLENMLRFREAQMQYAIVSGQLLSQKGLEKIENGQPLLAETLFQPQK